MVNIKEKSIKRFIRKLPCLPREKIPPNEYSVIYLMAESMSNISVMLRLYGTDEEPAKPLN